MTARSWSVSSQLACSVRGRPRHAHRCDGELKRDMPLHLIKLCVGCDTVKDLEDWIREKQRQRDISAKTKPEHLHTTRMVPKRVDELVGGGSLYWVIRGAIMCRQKLIAVRPFVDGEGIGRCRLALQLKVRLVEPRPCRAFQGWRYLEDGDAPRDLDRAAPGAAAMPEPLRRELRALGLL
jgi:hypothetical protein